MKIEDLHADYPIPTPFGSVPLFAYITGHIAFAFMATPAVEIRTEQTDRAARTAIAVIKQLLEEN